MSSQDAAASNRFLNGRCLCGAVHFVVDDAFLYAAYCHCSRCRGKTGSAFSAFGGVTLPQLRVDVGAEHVLRTEVSEVGYNARCSRCLAPLFSTFRERAHVQLGSLVDAPSRAPDHHIYVGSKAAWHRITDDLPQFEELPPA
jgi:hypothetical protein